MADISPVSVPFPPSPSCGGIPAPNICVCDRRYGEQLNPIECAQAVAKLRHLPFSDSSPPWTTQEGNCFVNIELAGPSPENINLTGSEEIVEFMALSLYRLCTQGPQMGGFLTAFLSRLLDWALDPTADLTTAIRMRGLDYTPSVVPPPNTSFITVTIHGPTPRKFAPGNTDPTIPDLLSTKLESQWKNTRQWDPRWARLMAGWGILTSKARSMSPGDTETWFRPRLRSDERMSYECDSKLGNPSAVDCSQVLQQSGKNMTIQPGDTGFVVSKTCSVAISVAPVGTDAISITWQQIQAALTLVIARCVALASGNGNGGRAQIAPPLRLINGHRKAKRNGSEVNAFDPLPANVNITVFQQTAPFTTYAAERRSCPWRAVQNGDDVKQCLQEL